MSSGSEQLPDEFLMNVNNTYLPISYSDSEPLSRLIEFYNSLGEDNFSSGPNKTLKDGINDIISINTTSNSFKNIEKYHAAYYYKVYSSLFTKELHDYLVKNNEVFKQFHNKAMDTKRQSYILRNEIQRTSEIATKNWDYNSKELKDIYHRLHGNRNSEFQTTIDNNTTLLRQGHMNYDTYLRQMEWNQFLRLMSACICMILIIGYLASIEISPDLIRLLFLAVFVIFIVNCILLYMANRKRHKLAYPRLRFPGYPVRNEEVQQSHQTGDCDKDKVVGSEMQCN
tara:strand:- start:407 stop:1258 length:852 start_codon:yes stop_codon:yes gene_type:complete